MKNKVGADFICMDYGLIDYHDNNTYTLDEKMRLTRFWGKWISDVRALTDLPIVISEFYGGSDADDLEFTAANHASCYYHALVNGASIGLQWNPEQGELDNYLFTDTATASGGEPTPLYGVVKTINDYFSAGTEIVNSTSSSEWLEALASAEHTLLINKKDAAVTVTVNGETVNLARYEVKVINTPLGSAVKKKVDPESLSHVNVRYLPTGLALYLTPARAATVTVRIYNLLGQIAGEFSQPLTAHSENVVPLLITTAVAGGAYFVHVTGLEKPFVRQIIFK